MYRSLKLLLVFGKIFGFLPVSGLFGGGNAADLAVRRLSIHGILPILVLGLLVFQFLLGFYTDLSSDMKYSPLEIVHGIRDTVFNAVGLFMVTFLYRSAHTILTCLNQWEQRKTRFYDNDPYLSTKSNLMAGMILFSAIGENALLHSIPEFDNKVKGRPLNSTYLASYYHIMRKSYANFIPFNDVLAISLFVANKLAWYAWNFCDIFISIVALIFFKTFQGQNHVILTVLNTVGGKADKSLWNSIVEDHEILVRIFKSFSDLLSPLVFCCTFTNIFHLGLHLAYIFRPVLYNGWSEDVKVMRQIYVCWAFAHMVIRSFVMFVFCGKVNQQIHKFSEVLELCPCSTYTKEVERCEQRIGRETYGFRGLDLFIIGTTFPLGVVHVIFTFEIVLLQSPG